MAEDYILRGFIPDESYFSIDNLDSLIRGKSEIHVRVYAVGEWGIRPARLTFPCGTEEVKIKSGGDGMSLIFYNDDIEHAPLMLYCCHDEKMMSIRSVHPPGAKLKDLGTISKIRVKVVSCQK